MLVRTRHLLDVIEPALRLPLNDFHRGRQVLGRIAQGDHSEVLAHHNLAEVLAGQAERASALGVQVAKDQKFYFCAQDDPVACESLRTFLVFWVDGLVERSGGLCRILGSCLDAPTTFHRAGGALGLMERHDWCQLVLGCCCQVGVISTRKINQIQIMRA